jgi:c-di-GMP-related signal transduction protein
VAPFVAAGLVVHAVGVDSLGLFQACVDAGCAGFQGRFRALPAIAQAATVDPGAPATAAELLAPDMDSERLESLIARPRAQLPAAALRQLGVLSRRREIGTVREAMTLLGLNADHAFTVGLFSMLPSLVNRPMQHALDGLGLPGDIELALLDGHPPYGNLLDRVVCHLDGAFRDDGGAVTPAGLDAAHRDALEWVEGVRAELER